MGRRKQGVPKRTDNLGDPSVVRNEGKLFDDKQILHIFRIFAFSISWLGKNYRFSEYF